MSQSRAASSSASKRSALRLTRVTVGQLVLFLHLTIQSAIGDTSAKVAFALAAGTFSRPPCLTASPDGPDCGSGSRVAASGRQSDPRSTAVRPHRAPARRAAVVRCRRVSGSATGSISADPAAANRTARADPDLVDYPTADLVLLVLIHIGTSKSHLANAVPCAVESRCDRVRRCAVPSRRSAGAARHHFRSRSR